MAVENLNPIDATLESHPLCREIRLRVADRGDLS